MTFYLKNVKIVYDKKEKQIGGMMRYDLYTAIARLKKNKVSIDETKKHITFKNRTGIKLLGTIDYLCKYHGYKRDIDMMVGKK